MTLKNNRAHLLCCFKLCTTFHSDQWIQTGVTVGKRSIQIKISDFFCPAWPWNLIDDLENNRSHLLCCFKLCASFQSHRWIQAGVTFRKHQNWVKISEFLSCLTLKYDRWPWKTIAHLFYAASSFVHHFKVMGEFKLELQSGRAAETCGLQGLVRLEPKLMGAIKSGWNWLNSKMCKFRELPSAKIRIIQWRIESFCWVITEIKK